MNGDCITYLIISGYFDTFPITRKTGTNRPAMVVNQLCLLIFTFPPFSFFICYQFALNMETPFKVFSIAFHCLNEKVTAVDLVAGRAESDAPYEKLVGPSCQQERRHTTNGCLGT